MNARRSRRSTSFKHLFSLADRRSILDQQFEREKAALLRSFGESNDWKTRFRRRRAVSRLRARIYGLPPEHYVPWWW
jgi:hypothetical protein